MKDKLKELKKKYDGKSVAKCVNMAKGLNKKLIEQGEELVNLLWYLEKTKRFKEFKGYEKLEFSDFIQEVCLIPYNRYRQMAYAYNWFPKEAKKYGPQIIQKIRQNVDSVSKIPKVLDEIEKKLPKADGSLKAREVIDNIIKQNSKPKPKKNNAETKSYWKHKYEDLWKKYQALLQENKELSEQLARQRVPLENYMKVREIMETKTAMA